MKNKLICCHGSFDLTVGKTYEWVEREKQSGYGRIIDDSGDDYWYPLSWFCEEEKMTLVQEIKNQVVAAMKSKDDIARNLLRCVLGEVSTLEGSANQAGKPVSDEQVCKIIRKVQAGNLETLQHVGSMENVKANLERENQILESFLPKLLTADEIKAKLSAVTDQIKASKGVGQAVGIAMKLFKESGDAVDGNEVKKAVEELRQ